MNKQDILKEISKSGRQLESHREQIKIIESCFNDYYEIISNSKILEWKKYSELTKAATFRIMYSNFELFRSILLSIKDSNYSSVEALSRVSIEYSVNLIYIQEIEDDTKAKQFFGNYLKARKTKLYKWNKFNIENSLDSSFTQQQISELELIEKVMNESFNFSAFKWPNARERFKLCRLELEYLTLFSSASDSVHSGSEDNFNYLQSLVIGDKELKKEIQKFNRLQEMSFAVYMSLSSLRFLLQAGMKLTDLNDIKSRYDKIEPIFLIIKKLLQEHDEQVISR